MSGMDNISKIKDRLSVVDVVSGYLKIQKAGANFKARCPFHNEKTPSFFISPERQIWHCFGCQKGGDIFTFVKEMEGIEFPEALRILAAKAGIELEEFDSTIRQLADSKDRLYEICESSARFFEKQLSHSGTGQRAVDYLKSRGLEEATMAKFRLGFAPGSWDSLSGYLRNSGFTEKDIVDAGMVIRRQETGDRRQGVYDRFRSRIMFPVSDVNGRVVGFTGRIFETRPEEIEGQYSPSTSSGRQANPVAKYINTPQTLIYDKSRILYGLNNSRNDIRIKDNCLLVEGNMDAIMSYQAGITNVVASSGTALTQTHLAILKRFTNNIDFCFDTDSAGAMATKRGIGMALGQGFNVKVVSLGDKECKDPADYVKKYGKEWEKVASSSAKPVMQFYFDKARESYRPESVESKKSVILAVAPFVKRLSSRVEKSHWTNQLAYLLRVKEDAVEADIMSAPDDLEAYALAQTAPDRSTSKSSIAIKIEAPDILNEALLSLVVRKPALFKQEIVAIDRNFLNPLASQVLDELAKENLEQFNFGSFTKKFDSDRALDLEFVYLRSQALWDGFGDEELKTEFVNIFNKLKQKTINSHLADLGYEMRAAESAGDKAKIGELAGMFNKLTQELAEIHNFQISKS
ncbi:MAG: DNA primase [Candidatus Yanofskybacteria bacterium RIFCSPLOWO2_01_FULL_43_22]|uniref:DNA primase n=1 Tax=Candidatus Yanofskybacteria bacterium RIFCSPLOWO2_01_FULL_43_22 TaxID=1802695 RepID=A0A1F8GEE7_9BACT|nr:MAG: DNA primase [Candidatus Yanofskybacteria bacterium RIFCSPLOWO2_01_FULL_43_22]